MKGQIWSSKEVIIIADRAQFAQMIITAENRMLKLNDVLNHPSDLALGPLTRLMPGLLKRTSKSSLVKEPARRI